MMLCHAEPAADKETRKRDISRVTRADRATRHDALSPPLDNRSTPLRLLFFFRTLPL